jgi:hypothetical protein
MALPKRQPVIPKRAARENFLYIFKGARSAPAA